MIILHFLFLYKAFVADCCKKRPKCFIFIENHAFFAIVVNYFTLYLCVKSNLPKLS